MPTLASVLQVQLGSVLAPAGFQSLLTLLVSLKEREASSLSRDEVAVCMERLKLALRVYCPHREVAERARERISAALAAPSAAGAPATSASRWPSGATVEVRSFEDAVRARMAAKDLAKTLGFSESGSVRIATAVSELARNIVFYAGSGSVSLEPRTPPHSPRVGLRIVAADQGPGIAHLDAVLAGTYRSTRGLGLGLRGVKQLVDEFDIDARPGKGTRVSIVKWL